MNQISIVIFITTLFIYASTNALPKLTIDEFLNSTHYPFISLSPNGQHLLLQTQKPLWQSDRYEHSLWLHQTQSGNRTLITNQLSRTVKPQWSPSGNWIFYFIDKPVEPVRTQGHHRDKPSINDQHFLHLYNIMSEEKILIDIGVKPVLAVTWGSDDSSLYFVSAGLSEAKVDNEMNVEWKDVIRYRQRKASDGSSIHRIDSSLVSGKFSVNITNIRDVDFLIDQLLYSRAHNKLVFSSVSPLIEDMNGIEIYSLELNDITRLVRLTYNEFMESHLQLSLDGKYAFFIVFPLVQRDKIRTRTQYQLYSVDITNGNVERWGKDFQGSIQHFAIRPQGGVYFLGQLGINIHVYVQQSPLRYPITQYAWNGTYRWIASASSQDCSSIAFVHSSFEKPSEVYFVEHFNQLSNAKAVTCENQLLAQRSLPIAKSYQWVNEEDDRTIEGILHYPPGKYGWKNLPLFVLIHGGPTDASLNMLEAWWYSWAPLAASQGWLVFEPNYRGSTGYGDAFLNEIRLQSLSRPGRDILSGVDRLVAQGIADPTKLAVGGYSYGGFLTNWLITQTTRFNAAVSGAGPVQQASFWGLSNIPVYVSAIVGGQPWRIPDIYYNESVLFKLGYVKTPTHIVTGANDASVPMYESLMLERGLHYLGVPAQLLVFPGSGHGLEKNPWHGKIKIREELKWLEKYGGKLLKVTTGLR